MSNNNPIIAKIVVIQIYNVPDNRLLEHFYCEVAKQYNYTFSVQRSEETISSKMALYTVSEIRAIASAASSSLP